MGAQRPLCLSVTLLVMTCVGAGQAIASGTAAASVSGSLDLSASFNALTRAEGAQPNALVGQFDSQRLAETPCSPDAKKKSETDCPVNPLKKGGPQQTASNNEYILFAQYDFASPLFWVSQGKLFARTAVNVLSSSGDLYVGPFKLARQNSSGLEFQQVLQYGITDNISIQAQFLNVPTLTDTTHFTGGGSFKQKFDGWENPEVILGYRAFYQPRDPVYINLYAGYSPDLFAANPATFNHSGSVASGRENFWAEEIVGYEVDDYLFEVAATVVYQTQAHIGSQQFASGWEEKIDTEFFHFVNDRWSYDINAGYLMNNGFHTTGDIFVEGEGNYYVIPGTLQLSAFYEHDFLPDERSDFGSHLRNRSADEAGIRIKYLFDLTGGDRD